MGGRSRRGTWRPLGRDRLLLFFFFLVQAASVAPVPVLWGGLCSYMSVSGRAGCGAGATCWRRNALCMLLNLLFHSTPAPFFSCPLSTLQEALAHTTHTCTGATTSTASHRGDHHGRHCGPGGHLPRAARGCPRAQPSSRPRLGGRHPSRRPPPEPPPPEVADTRRSGAAPTHHLPTRLANRQQRVPPSRALRRHLKPAWPGTTTCRRCASPPPRSA